MRRLWFRPVSGGRVHNSLRRGDNFTAPAPAHPGQPDGQAQQHAAAPPTVDWPGVSFSLSHHARIIARLPKGGQSRGGFQPLRGRGGDLCCAGVLSQLVVHLFDLFIANFAPEMQRLSSIYVSFVGHF